MSQKTSVAKDVFAYLLTYSMLYVGAISLIALLWQIIHVQFPDPTVFLWSSPYDSMRNSMASLIVVWPVFLLMMRYLVHDLKRAPEKVDLWVRKWLTYLTIFVAAVTIIIDLISLLNLFLGGELTLRFVLKVCVVLAVAVGVLGYEFWELKRPPQEGKKLMQLLSAGSIIVIFCVIVAGFYFVGTPTTAREQKLDLERVSDLQSLQDQIVAYWNQKNALPEKLGQLIDPFTGFQVPVDPMTEQPYEYRMLGELRFELCATFTRQTPVWYMTQPKPDMVRYDEFGNVMTDDWTHGTGRTCFERTLDPERQKTYLQTIP